MISIALIAFHDWHNAINALFKEGSGKDDINLIMKDKKARDRDNSD